MFWSRDTGVLSQWAGADPDTAVTFRPTSKYPQCTADLSFWLPLQFSPNDFYDVVREVGGDRVEQVELQDQFTHPRTGRTSHCYRIVYRDMDRTLTQEEANTLHRAIAETATAQLGVTIR